jgi:hypothetical protein
VECKDPSFTERKESKSSKWPSTFPVTLHTSLALTLYQMLMPAIPSLSLNRISTRYPFSLVTFDNQVLLPFQNIFRINTPSVIKIPEVRKTITTPHAGMHSRVCMFHYRHNALWLACLPLYGCWIMNNWMWEKCTFKRWHTVHTVNLELDNNHPISNPQGWLFQLHAARKNNPIRIHAK